MDHGAPQPSDPDCPPEHAKMGHCTPKVADPMASMEGMAAPSSASGTDLPPGDAVLVKGSLGSRMSVVIEALTRRETGSAAA